MRWKPYPSYLESGADHLGPIPAHWSVAQLKRICSFAYGDSLSSGQRTDGSVNVYGSNGPVGKHDSANTLAPAIVIGRKGSFGKVTFVGEPCFAIDTAFYLDGRHSKANLRWLYYLLQSIGLDCFSQDTGVPGLARESAYDVKVPLLPTDEQLAQAIFLDRETAKIDGLIAEQRDLIQRLEEKRESVIHKAVTSGARTEWENQKTNSPWLPVIPSAWAFGALTRISHRVVVGIAEAATHAYVDHGTPILRATNIRPNEIVGELLYINSEFANDRGSKSLLENDLVTVRTGNAGVTAVVPHELDGCQCFTMLVTTLLKGHSAEFYSYYMNSAAARHYFTCEGWGTAQVNISVPILKALPVPIPPFAEQVKIVDFIRDRIGPINRLIAEANTSIALLQEHRSALITAVVTGKVDVRDAVKESA